MMLDNKFIPGGRILAGIGSPHGNALNCYVQDGDPDDHPTDRTLQLAKKLALVTKVGGGNGLNLDYLGPKTENDWPVGRAYLTIKRDHPDAHKVASGTFYDQVTGQYKTVGYKTVEFLPDDLDTPTPDVDKALVVEDSVEGIWDAATEMVNCLVEGKNVLVDLSHLRTEGSPVAGSGGSSSGPASFAVEVFDNFARWANLGAGIFAGPVATLRYVFAPTLRVIRQAGVRRGAGMATLSAWHEDVFDFITAKDLDREEAEGDISTFNISVLASDQFMAYASDPELYESRVFRAIAEHAHSTGEPGLIFIDTVNRHNALSRTDGPIRASNPCGEVFLYPGEPCDLGAINLSAFVVEREGLVPYFDWSGFRDTVRTAVRFLDDVLDAHVSPLPEIAEAIEDKRRIGLGVMGLADALIKLGLRYGSPFAQTWTKDLATVMRQEAVKESETLGLTKGVPAGVDRAGLSRRNIALLTVAPTGTTSMLAGVSSGVEPVFSATISRRIGTEYKTIAHPLADNPAFVTAHEVTPHEHVMMQAAFQKGMDSGDQFAGNSISKTINLPNEAGVEAVEAVYRTAWEHGCKGITVYRDGSRSLQVLTEVKEDEAEEDVLRGPDVSTVWTDEGPTEVKDSRVMTQEEREVLFNDLFRSETPDPNYTDVEQLSRYEGLYAPEPGLDEGEPTEAGIFFPGLVRPPAVRGRTYKYEVGAKKVYVTVNRGPDDRIVEVFINFSRPTDQERTAGDIVGRLISLALKHGAPAQDVVNHLSGHMDRTGGFVSGLGHFDSIWDAVAQALQQETDAKPDISHIVPDPCPDCGAQMAREEGCMKCHSCGYAACM